MHLPNNVPVSFILLFSFQGMGMGVGMGIYLAGHSLFYQFEMKMIRSKKTGHANNIKTICTRVAPRHSTTSGTTR